jgi:hypothetical protein
VSLKGADSHQRAEGEFDLADIHRLLAILQSAKRILD